MKIQPSLKLILISIVLIVFAFSCHTGSNTPNRIIFENHEWYLGDKLVIRNDSCVSFTRYDTIKKTSFNPMSFAIGLNDTSLIFTRYQEQGYFDNNREFVVTHLEKLIDTVVYDLNYINKKPKLILYTDPFPTILSTKQNVELPETHHFNQIKFMIADYTIGEQIDRSIIKTRGIYNYPNYTIEDCEFTENKDITFKIIGYNTIFSIERRRIEDYRVKEIVNVVTSKLGVKPEYRPMRQWIDGSDYEYEFYRWSGHGVQINLSRSKYVGNSTYKTLVGNDDWTLSYDDSYVQAMLVETYRNGKPQSSIIN